MLLDHKSIEGLSSYQTLHESDLYKKFQVKWEISQNEDYPCWEEAWNYFDLNADVA